MAHSESKPVTREVALSLVAEAERAFGAGDVESIMAGYTDDIVVKYADFPEISGKPAVEKFLKARFSRQKDYELTKRLRMLEGNMIGNYWEGTWTDSRTGKKMCGRGTEFWTMRGNLVSYWEATFNVWEDGKAGSTPIT